MRSDGSELMPAVEVNFCRSQLEKKCFQAGKLLRIVFHFHNKIKTGLDVKINSYPCFLLLSIYFQIIEEVIIQLNRRFPSKPTSCINVTADDSLERTQSQPGNLNSKIQNGTTKSFSKNQEELSLQRFNTSPLVVSYPTF